MWSSNLHMNRLMHGQNRHERIPGLDLTSERKREKVCEMLRYKPKVLVLPSGASFTPGYLSAVPEANKRQPNINPINIKNTVRYQQTKINVI